MTMTIKIRRLIDKQQENKSWHLFMGELVDGGYIDLCFDFHSLEYYKYFIGGQERVKLEFVK